MEHDRVVQFLARTPAARNNKDIEARTIFKCFMRDDFHIACGNDVVGMLGHQKDFKGWRFFPSLLLVQASCRENLKGAAEIEYFNVFKKNDSDTLPLHLLPPFHEPNAHAGLRGLKLSRKAPLRSSLWLFGKILSLSPS